MPHDVKGIGVREELGEDSESDSTSLDSTLSLSKPGSGLGSEDSDLVNST